MAKSLSENSKIVFEYVKEHQAEGITANDIAEGTGLNPRSVNGIITSAFQRKGWMVRKPAEIELEDGTHKAIKLIELTDEGAELDPDNIPEKEAE